MNSITFQNILLFFGKDSVIELFHINAIIKTPLCQNILTILIEKGETQLNMICLKTRMDNASVFIMLQRMETLNLIINRKEGRKRFVSLNAEGLKAIETKLNNIKFKPLINE
jgi:hypothetical protein